MAPLILMYHRIAEPRVDPWGLAVSPFHFAEQMSLLRKTRHPMSLTEFVDRWREGSLPEHAVAVTFDDGYADNVQEAKPRLDAADIPGTIFLATSFLDQSVPFWWDELAELILAGIESDKIQLAGRSIDIGRPEPPRSERSWTFSRQATTPRQKLLVETWSRLLKADQKPRAKVLSELRAQVLPDFMSRAGRPMSSVEVTSLIDGGLVDIGAHTVTHPSLVEISPRAASRELANSRRTCEEIVGRPVRALAYPFGHENEGVRFAAEQAGFDFALGVVPRTLADTDDRYALPRVQVPDVDADLLAELMMKTRG